MNPDMSKFHSLPVPEPIALEQSRKLTKYITQSIEKNGGWVPFDYYMELALYTPKLGYYTAGATKLGHLAVDGSDFVTAPELGPLFGQTLALQLSEIFALIGHAKILEFGAGSGRLATDLLLTLEEEGTPCVEYAIIELSGELRARQYETISRLAPHMLDRVQWLDVLPKTFSGVIIGNEVLDAMPVNLCVRQKGSWWKLGVTHQSGQFVWEARPVNTTPINALRAIDALPRSIEYFTEIHEAGSAFIRSIGELLTNGVLLLIDYGFPATEYYHPQRRQGTLMCHYRHHAHGDPFYYPGLQDITAHVEFTGIAKTASEVGLMILGYTSQARFLLNNGITRLLEKLDPNDLSTFLPSTAAAQKLLSEAEMGELFKVIAFGRGLGDTTLLTGFSKGDRSHTL
ncbi:class I SAM-dependent methyltransferase [Candidatus Pandoraea novymonadis]|uniref:SAM-dependent methyltransferase n=1 Tax=Candidatus Pandoraea novymonadis TaxID=1808959 RepID=A0ABX5FCV7_9BURK|nr:SAM-dependent methyltransferase [Candidatus Pandoraea novymonadis]PSB91624.1 hypothetical protein BZL35_00841 [Candidatus Pandoraea novymonadis]